jgi:DNA-binding LytR/AlgR family response regulator
MNIGGLRVLIVDDEPIARRIMEGYVGMAPQLELVGSCANALEAFAVLSAQKVDLLLLDIDMPQVNGLSFLKSLRQPPKVIFTTAYPQHALESYELDAVDYLLKPVQVERFMRAVGKLAVDADAPVVDSGGAVAEAPSDILFVKSEGRLVKIDLGEVQAIEGLRDYVVFHSSSGKLTIHSTMKALEEKLKASPEFLRIHKSYIVNLRFVQEVDGNCMRVGKLMLAIGITYQEAVQGRLAGMKLL